ncbi:DUF6261 family protein [Chryseobacterium sp. CCH4-E10]|uniref:DUF6261 family protein n=1 Tax=Chryseobacterium sp. CCH4-E10 TaxID=1768758 RepID=UPI000836E1EA|nr:DUF6261 family protein [Chryseobacterium sp. CCH4-E10]
MEKVKKIYLEKLNNKDFYQLIENVITISDTEPLLSTISASLKADIPQMKLSFKKESLTEETQQVVALDKKRDRAFIRLKSFLESETYNDEEPTKADAANSLLTIIENFGGSKIPKFNLNGETAVLTNLISALNAKTNEITMLDLSSRIVYLKNSNESFQAFYKDRGDAAKDLADINPFYRLRKPITAKYRRFISAIENMPEILPSSSPAIASIIMRLNVELDKFEALISKPKNDSENTAPGLN